MLRYFSAVKHNLFTLLVTLTTADAVTVTPGAVPTLNRCVVITRGGRAQPAPSPRPPPQPPLDHGMPVHE